MNSRPPYGDNAQNLARQKPVRSLIRLSITPRAFTSFTKHHQNPSGSGLVYKRPWHRPAAAVFGGHIMVRMQNPSYRKMPKVFEIPMHRTPPSAALPAAQPLNLQGYCKGYFPQLQFCLPPQMVSKCNCLDNAVIENFFGILKTGPIDYIDYYNSRRVKKNSRTCRPLYTDNKPS